MHIVADENIPLLDEFFAGLGSITRLPGRAIDRAALRQADALLVRSVTRVDQALLRDTPVRFVGTCTIGTDHLDLDGLRGSGVSLASAPGCNARGVVEYVLSCLLTLAERRATDWRQQRVGIVGVGEVGTRLVRVLATLGVECLLCDPPRAARGETGFVGLDELIAQADVISLHVPLSREGAHPTWHLFDQARLQALRPNAWLINSSRGPVIDNAALEQVMTERQDLALALDVWEHEPWVARSLAARCELATPHIAGYSLDGKLRGTEQIYQAFCRFLGIDPELSLEQLAPQDGLAELQLSATTPTDWMLSRALRWVYDVRDDDARFRRMLAEAVDDAALRAGFDRLRKDYPLRRECAHLRLSADAGLSAELARLFSELGFSV
ncbi:4-phosphoerythronate dehydrogenase PdxB [Pseudomonas jilinensis]|uniref:Erythronate-4-phosphate dehydrogenase n=1 Tax=Pseudomonas jilinensis TaxID=2078689 RepID=A0A396RUC5_9PSED|nr:4-phosphoerythronate dehydrogenase PdxB [Pseudomonas jilinensis]RHW20138.1 4-phosphoerythronate dehydrogenase PdxB [Pseudomonas jilinensis]